jgi:quercetin dioxygenase-like cupin family protein
MMLAPLSDLANIVEENRNGEGTSLPGNSPKSLRMKVEHACHAVEQAFNQPIKGSEKMDNTAKKAPQEIGGMVPIHGFTEAIHRGDADIPFVDLGGGNFYQLLHVDMRLSLWVMRMKLQPGFEVQRHYHTGQVFAVTLSGKWLYREYPEVVNVKGSYLFEPAHSVHTLYVPNDNTEVTERG